MMKERSVNVENAETRSARLRRQGKPLLRLAYPQHRTRRIESLHWENESRNGREIRIIVRFIRPVGLLRRWVFFCPADLVRAENRFLFAENVSR